MGKKKPVAIVEPQIDVEVTAETLTLNPELVEAGVQVGEIIQVITEGPKADEAAKAKSKYKVHFGVNIPEMRKEYSVEELEADLEVCAYLVEIGSQAVTEL